MDRNRQRLVGKVVSDAMDRTLVVSVERLVKHKLYKKYIRQSKKYYAHDPNNLCSLGDVVVIEESRPVSRLKRWRVKNIQQKAVS